MGLNSLLSGFINGHNILMLLSVVALSVESLLSEFYGYAFLFLLTFLSGVDSITMLSHDNSSTSKKYNNLFVNRSKLTEVGIDLSTSTRPCTSLTT